jgi:hypothetical protein
MGNPKQHFGGWLAGWLHLGGVCAALLGLFVRMVLFSTTFVRFQSMVGIFEFQSFHVANEYKPVEESSRERGPLGFVLYRTAKLCSAADLFLSRRVSRN